MFESPLSTDGQGKSLTKIGLAIYELEDANVEDDGSVDDAEIQGQTGW